MVTGLFFHYQQGSRLRDFPAALGSLLSRESVRFHDAYYPGRPATDYGLPPIDEQILKSVHDPEMVDRIKAAAEYEGALYSASGTLAAARSIARGEITNAFVFTGFGDHHAGRNFFGGGCYFNGVAIAVHELRRQRLLGRFTVIDTDAHHGDGSWDLFKDDPDTLYLCICPAAKPQDGTNFDITIHPPLADDDYLNAVEQAVTRSVPQFGPELIFWNWGYDGTRGEYGDMGLSPAVHSRLARLFHALANSVCRGRLLVVLCGGSSRKLAKRLIPVIIDILSDFRSAEGG